VEEKLKTITLSNPLLSHFKTDFESIPFDKIKSKHFIPAIKKGINLVLDNIRVICNNVDKPTFENTNLALESCGSILGRNSSILFNLNSAETTDEIQLITSQAAPLLTKFQNDINLNEVLFDRIRYVYENNDQKNLNSEQKTLLEKQYKGFVRNGALLGKSEKKKLRIIDAKLAKLSLSFGQNILAETQAYELHIKDEKKLRGLPESLVEMTKSIADKKGKKGWIVTLDYPIYIPFITYSEERELRKEITLAFGKRGYQKNKNNNTEIIIEIISLRKERAKLLGYNSHAEFILEERMASSISEVKKFLEELAIKAFPAAEKEWKAMNTYAKSKLNLKKIEKWDSAFVSEKMKKAELDLDELELKPFFSLDNVLSGIFEILKKLYDLEFKENYDIQRYNNEVRVFEVYKNTKFYALLYADFFPRPGKRDGAWMTSFRSQKKNQRPHVSIVCNFSRPTKTKPSLLTFQEVTTLFHEFGHALHGILANTSYSSLSGTNVYWDFVELPSQIMENWCYEKEAILIYAKHYKTGKALPRKFIEKIKKIKNFQQGLHTLRQISLGYLDMSYHTKNSNKIKNVKKHEKSVIERFQFTKDIDENCLSTSFSHIFQGGYAAGYYSYKWAEVIEAHAFELFLENGIFDKKTSAKFQDNILSKGGTEHPMILYKKFRGKVPNSSALLKRAGLI
jgi:peptidyl-dipeptidase Dcp